MSQETGKPGSGGVYAPGWNALFRLLTKYTARNDKRLSLLQKVIADYVEDVSQARAYHTDAERLVNTHPGFDDNGKVVNPAVAHDTTIAIISDLDKALFLLQKGWEEVYHAFTDLTLPAWPAG